MCSLLVVLAWMSVGHCLRRLIADYGSFFNSRVSPIACISYLYAVFICVGFKRCSLTKIIIISINPLVIISNRFLMGAQSNRVILQVNLQKFPGSYNNFDCFPVAHSISQPLKDYTDVLLCLAITEELPAHPYA